VRLRDWLLRMFPAAWRDRYGHEVADLLTDIESHERRLRASDLLDLVRAGASQRCVELWRRVAHPRRPLAARIATSCVGLVAVALVALFTTSSMFGPTSSSPTTHVVAGSHVRPVGPETVESAQQTAAQQAAAQAAAQAAQQAAAAQAAAQQAGNGSAARAAQQAAAQLAAVQAAAAEQTVDGGTAPAG